MAFLKKRFLPAIIIAAFAIAALLSAYSIIIKNQSSQDLQNVKSFNDGGIDAAYIFTEITAGWSSALLDKIRKGDLRPEDFEKLDFSFPSDPAYGDNPQYEWFNPEGFSFTPVTIESLEPLKFVYSDHRGVRLAFSLHRHIDAGNFRDELYVSYPYPLAVKCTNNVTTIIDARKDNQNIIFDQQRVLPLSTVEGCVKDAAGKIYHFSLLATRVRKEGQTKWQTY